MDWADIADVIDDWHEKTAATSQHLRPIAAMVYADDVGYYRTADDPTIALYGAKTAQDAVLCKWAAAEAGPVRSEPLTLEELSGDAGWIKVAYSHSLRRAGELLNFFPGQYPGGIPNAPSPLAAMLTTGLLGAGLGYGAGKLVGGLLPERYGRKVRRTGAVVGGATAALPAAAWAATNHHNHHSILDGWPLDVPPVEPIEAPDISEWLKQSHDAFGSPPGKYLAGAFAAMEKEASSFAMDGSGDAHSLEVNINALGQTLWELGAPPQLAATTMGAMYAAQQMPDHEAQPGIVNGRQLGRLAANAAGDYMNGLLVGAVLNTVIGTPYPATAYGGANAALGLISEVVPKLFGR